MATLTEKLKKRNKKGSQLSWDSLVCIQNADYICKTKVEGSKLCKVSYSKESSKERLLLNAVLVVEFQKIRTFFFCKTYHRKRISWAKAI